MKAAAANSRPEQSIPSRLIRSTRAIAAGWAALLLLQFLERAILTYGYRLAPSSWWQTAGFCLDLLVFTAAGWTVGRLDRRNASMTVALFCLSLLPFNIDPLNVPFTARLLVQVFSNSRYLTGLLISLVTNAVFLASVWIGGTLGGGPLPPTTLAGFR
jgi:hypothetical protein